ncbi:MAG: iron-sulfur cluster assembly accessory protein [Thermomicrobiales bacterium]
MLTEGVRVVVDRFSSSMLDGAEIDYVESLMGAGFSVNNPNAITTCGCGHSFRTASSASTARAATFTHTPPHTSAPGHPPRRCALTNHHHPGDHPSPRGRGETGHHRYATH